MEINILEVGATLPFSGCFTHEEWLIGKNPVQMAVELGFLRSRVMKGVYIVYARNLPKAEHFDLGGYARFKTSLFMDYKDKEYLWNEKKFEATYKDGKRMNITIDEAKDAWLKQMARTKLVKMITAIPHINDQDYISGNKAPQIIIKKLTPVQCIVATFLTPNTSFRGVFTK